MCVEGSWWDEGNSERFFLGGGVSGCRILVLAKVRRVRPSHERFSPLTLGCYNAGSDTENLVSGQKSGLNRLSGLESRTQPTVGKSKIM